MSLELLTKSIEDHGKAVAGMAQKTDQAIDDIKTLGHRMLDIEQRFATGADFTSTSTPFSQDTESAIRRFIKSPQLEAMKDGAQSTGRVELAQFGIKALVNEGRGQAGDNGAPIQPQRATGVYNDPRPAQSLLSVLPSIPVATASYEFTQLGAYSNAAGYQVKEGDQKAEGEIDLTVISTNVATIAHWTRASVQVLDDAPSLEVYISNLLTYGVLSKLENEIINGAGGIGKITGLLAQATPFVPGPLMSAAERIGAAAAQMKASGWAPSVVVVNPLDWFAISISKGSDGQYLLGSPQSPAPLSLWGCSVVTSPSIAIGKALVLDSANIAVLDRMTPTVIASRFDRDNMVTNMVTILAEMRAGLAVYARAALYSVDLYPS